MLDRMEAEKTKLGLHECEAFDKEYMTLVTNTQQSVINLLESPKAAAKEPEVKKLMTNMTTGVKKRLNTAARAARSRSARRTRSGKGPRRIVGTRSRSACSSPHPVLGTPARSECSRASATTPRAKRSLEMRWWRR